MLCLEEEHELGLCECLTEYNGIVRPRSKEHLDSFGGNMSIAEYRQKFMMIRSYTSIEKNFTTNESILTTFQRVHKLRGRHQTAAWGFEYIKFPPPPDYVVEYVKVMPLSGKVMRDDDTPMLLTGNETRVAKMTRRRASSTTTNRARTAAAESTETEHDMDVCVSTQDPSANTTQGVSSSAASSSSSSSSNPCTFKAALRPKPTSRTNGPAKDPTLLPDKRRPAEPDRVMTNEQILLVNEEQAFYTQNLRKYGNLMDSMGISISRLGSESHS